MDGLKARLMLMSEQPIKYNKTKQQQMYRKKGLETLTLQRNKNLTVTKP